MEWILNFIQEAVGLMEHELELTDKKAWEGAEITLGDVQYHGDKEKQKKHKDKLKKEIEEGRIVIEFIKSKNKT